MILDSSVFPLSTGGGTASIAGFEWSEKTSDFTAEANKAYYCDTALDDILMTLPSSPVNGDEVAFLIIGANKLKITTTDKIKSSLLAVDYGKQISENYLLIIFEYVNSTVGWNWNSRYNSFITDAYVGNGTLLTYTSTSTLDGVFNWLGTSGGTVSYSNPYPSIVGITGRRDSVGTNPTVVTPENLLNKNTSNGANLDLIIASAGILITLPTGTLFKPSTIAIYHIDQGSGQTTGYMEGRKEDGSFVSLGSYNFASNWNIINYTDDIYFNAFYIKSTLMYYQSVRAFEMWGLYLG